MSNFQISTQISVIWLIKPTVLLESGTTEASQATPVYFYQKDTCYIKLGFKKKFLTEEKTNTIRQNNLD